MRGRVHGGFRACDPALGASRAVSHRAALGRPGPRGGPGVLPLRLRPGVRVGWLPEGERHVVAGIRRRRVDLFGTVAIGIAGGFALGLWCAGRAGARAVQECGEVLDEPRPAPTPAPPAANGESWLGHRASLRRRFLGLSVERHHGALGRICRRSDHGPFDAHGASAQFSGVLRRELHIRAAIAGGVR